VRFVGKEELGAGGLRHRAQQRVLANEGGPALSVGFDQALLGPLEHEIQAVQVVQTATAAERAAEAALHELPDHLPVPVGQVDASGRRRRLDGRFQFGLLLAAKSGGTRQWART